MRSNNYKLARYEDFEGTQRTNSQPRYFPRNVISELIPMDSLDGWDITYGDSGDSIKVVASIDKSKWSGEAIQRINPIIPNGKRSCIKIEAHEGTVMSYTLDESLNIAEEALSLYAFIDTEGNEPLGSYDDAVDIRLYSESGTALHRFRIQPKDAYDNNWYNFSLHPSDFTSLNSSGITDVKTIEISTRVPLGKKVVAYVGVLSRVKNNSTRGKILIDFDDNFKPYFDEAYMYMTGKHGYRGNLILNGSRGDGNNSLYVTPNELLRMQDDGWNMLSHGWDHINWRGKDYLEQKRNMVRNTEWMADLGLWIGHQVMATTNYSLDYNMQHNLDRLGFRIIRAGYYNARGAYFTDSLVGMPMTQPLPANEIDASVSINTWKTHLKNVQDSKATAINVFHNFARTPNDLAHFKSLIDEIQNYDIDVVTYADILMGNVD